MVFRGDKGRDSFRNLKLPLTFWRIGTGGWGGCGGLFENISFKRSGQSWKFLPRCLLSDFFGVLNHQYKAKGGFFIKNSEPL